MSNLTTQTVFKLKIIFVSFFLLPSFSCAAREPMALDLSNCRICAFYWRINRYHHQKQMKKSQQKSKEERGKKQQKSHLFSLVASRKPKSPKSRTTTIWSAKSLQTHIWFSSKSPKSRTTFTSSLASSPSHPLPSPSYPLPIGLLTLCWLQFGSYWGWEVGDI